MIILLSFCYYHSAIIILLGWLIANSDPLPASIVLLLLHELVLPNCRAATVCLVAVLDLHEGSKILLRLGVAI